MPGFFSPQYLIILIIIPLFLIIYKISLNKRKKAALKFSSLDIVKKAIKNETKIYSRNTLLVVLLILSFASMIIALSDPHIPIEQEKEGVNIVLAIDVSGSMTAEDYEPSRIEAAKEAAKTLIQSLKEKDSVGIVIFSDGATTASYLTPFKENALEKLSAINSQQGATAIGDGLALAIDMVSSIPNKKKMAILLSDGVNNSGTISPDEAISFAKNNSVQTYTIGVGSEGKTLLGHDFFGRAQYAELDETTLKKIANSTNGKYFKSVDNKTLENIYSSLSNEIKREKEETSIKDWFIAIAITLMGIYGFVRFAYKRVIQ